MKSANQVDSIQELLCDDDIKNELSGNLKLPYFSSENELAQILINLDLYNRNYSDFVISAMLYCLEYEVSRKNINLFDLVNTLMLLLLDKKEINDTIFDLLDQTKLFCDFSHECVKIINKILDYRFFSIFGKTSVNLVFIKRTLILFKMYFPNKFISECINSCFDESTYGPFLLALKVSEVRNDISYANTELETLHIYTGFQILKKK